MGQCQVGWSVKIWLVGWPKSDRSRSDWLVGQDQVGMSVKIRLISGRFINLGFLSGILLCNF